MSSPPPKHSLSSPTSGNTPHPVLPTPSSSTSVSIRQNSKASQLRRELEQQLLEKQKQLQESSSGIGKNVLARQVAQLQDRIKEMDLTPPSSSTSNSDELQPASVDRLRSLERDLTSYRSHPLSPGISSIRNKEKLMNQRSAGGLDPLPSPSTSTLLPPTHGHDSTSLLPLPPPPTGSTPTKRRSKIPNTDRRNTDIEFATEIGQGLLLEVRKMQALLQEKEEKLRTLENQKADLERAAEAMAKQMRQREENEEKLKEETWNLELAKQELTISVTELQQNLSKANVEQNKLAKQVNELRTEIEQLRDREEKLTNSIDNMKQRHEQDMSSIRRHAAAIQREKTDQTKQIEALTSELAIAKAQSRIGKHVSTEVEPSTRTGESTDDQAASVLAVKNDTSPTSSPPSSPKQSPARNQAMEVETLKTSLAHAHRMVSNLRSNLHKEKTEKFEFKKLLAESQETIEQLQNDPRMWVDAGPTRGASGSTSNLTSREDGTVPGRRSHKASTSSTKRRGGRKSTTGRQKLKNSSQNATADDGDSVYSYSSMSDQDDSEDIYSFDESDAGFDNNNNSSNKKKTVGFTPLSSELSQVQMQKPVMVDAEVNTDPIENFGLPIPAFEKSEPRSLGDELGMAMSQKEEEGPLSSMKNAAGGLVAGAAAVLGVESLLKPTGVEISIQTDSRELEQETTNTMSIEPSKSIEFELVSKDAFSVEPEDPSIALAATAAATAAAIAAARLASLDAAVTTSTQSDPEDPSIAEAATAAAIAKSRSDDLEAAVDSSVQCEEDPSIAEAAEAATAAAIASGIAAGIAKSRSDALEAGIDSSVQHEEDPSIAEAAEAATATATAAAIASGIAAGIAKLQSEARESAVDTSVQYEEDPSIAEANEVANAAAIASGIAAGIAKLQSEAREAAVDSSVQYEEDSSAIETAEAATAAATAAAIASGIAAGIAKLQSEARESAVDTSVQYEEDPSIAEANEAANAAALAAGIAAGIAKSRAEALEAAVDSSVQSEEVVEDSSIAEAVDAAKAAAIAVGIAAGIAKLQSEARESAVDTSVQYEEDPSIAEAAEAATAAAIASGIAAGIAKSRSDAIEAAVDSSVQYEEDPSIAEAANIASAAALAAATAAAIAKSRSEALEAGVDSSVQYEEDPSIAEAAEIASAAALAAATAAAIAKSRSEALEAAVDSSVQYEEDPSIAEADKATSAAALASGIAAGIAKARSEALEAGVDSSVQYEEDPSIAEAAKIASASALAAATAAAIAKSRSEALEAAVDSSVQYEEDPSIAAAALSKAIAETRTASLEAAIDSSVQYEEPEEDPSKAIAAAAALASATAAAVFTARNLALDAAIDTSTQIDKAEGVDTAVQSVSETDAPIGMGALAEHKDTSIVPIPVGLGNGYHTSSETNKPIESVAQNGIQARDVDVQQEVDSTNIGSQLNNETATNKDVAAIIARPPNSQRSMSDSDDEFYDAQSRPSSRRTINSFNNMKPDSRNSHLREEVIPNNEDTNNVKDDHNDSDKAIIAAAATTAAALATNAYLNNKSASDHDDNALARSVNSEPQPSTVLENTHDINELNNSVPSEKMYSKSETDALIAAAVAAALANKLSSDDDKDLEESKRHTCDMSKNHDGDSAVVNPSPSMSRGSRIDDGDQEDEDYGNVVVHLPREEDIITSLPVDLIAERQRDRSILPTKGTSQSDYFENIKPEVVKQDVPELTQGPTIVFAQEPEEKEITEADIPHRPANPPPEALLSRASLSPAFTNNSRSMSPTSSKGKGPLVEHSDLEVRSALSHESLQLTAAQQQQQQQQHLNKRESISVSSISTTNTNEQLQSIHSSQNDALTRNSAATDPTMINLITQTMIGDWMYKYTRKAVGGGLSEYRHQRYFWIHPYTRTLYWSTNAPGLDGTEAKAKSALIENISSVPDYSNSSNGTPNVSLLIQTSNRQIKLTAPNMEKHELWFEAISHLLARNRNSNGLTLLNDTPKRGDNPNARSVSSGTTGSLLNRPSFRRLHDIFKQPSSSTSMVTTDDHVELDDDDEALEDVRMCCNGKHHVSKLEKDHAHRHQYRKRKSRPAVSTVG